MNVIAKNLSNSFVFGANFVDKCDISQIQRFGSRLYLITKSGYYLTTSFHKLEDAQARFNEISLFFSSNARRESTKGRDLIEVQ